MRSGSRFQVLTAQLESDGTSIQSRKCSRISYSRGFLLSLGKTERCKGLPGDFDPSILHEFEDTSTGLLMLSPLNSDSGLSGSLSQGLLRNPYTDGVLGSGCMSVASSSKTQGSNVCNIVSKSEKPYRPPHFYKVMPQSGRGNTDSFNEETFGSDSLPLTRKDQHEAILEKHTKTLDEPKAEDCRSTKSLLSTPILSSRQPTEGFVSGSLEKNAETNLSTNSYLTEVASVDGKLMMYTLSGSKEIQPENCSGSNDHLHETTNAKELYQCRNPTMLQESYTCKDLKQSILSDVNLVQSWNESSSEELHLKFESNKETRNNSGTRNTSRFESSLPHNLIRGTGFTKEEKSRDLSLILKDSSFVEANALEPWMHPLLVADDKIVLSPILDKSEAPTSSKCDNQVDFNNNNDEKAEFMEEFNLPDEDSLFTFDYSIAPQDTILTPNDDSTEARKLAAFHLPLGNEKTGLPGFGNTTFGMQTYNIHAQHCYRQMSCFIPQYPQQGQMSSKLKTTDPRPYPSNYPSHNWFPRNVPSYPFQQPHAGPARFDSPLSHPQFGQTPFPSSRDLSYGLMNHLPHSPNYQQRGHVGMPNPDPGFGTYNSQVILKQMENVTFRARAGKNRLT